MKPTKKGVKGNSVNNSNNKNSKLPAAQGRIRTATNNRWGA